MDAQKIREAVHRLLSLDRAHRRAIEKQVGEMGLHRSQHRLLMKLSRSEEMPSQAELARRLEISPPAVATALKRLEKEGYIVRQDDQNDCRNQKVRLTEKGREILLCTCKRFEGVDREMLCGISEAELEMFCDIAARMQHNLEAREQ